MSIVVPKREITIETQGLDDGQPLITIKPILYFVAVNGHQCQQIAAYTEFDARRQAGTLLKRVSSFYQVFPVDVDYLDYPDVQAKKDLALGGFGGRAA